MPKKLSKFEGKYLHFLNLPPQLPLANAISQAENILGAKTTPSAPQADIIVRSDPAVGTKGKITISDDAFALAVAGAAEGRAKEADAWWGSLGDASRGEVFLSNRESFVVPAGKRGRPEPSSDDDDDDDDDGGMKVNKAEGLDGKVICFTGTLSTMTRDEASKMAVKAGATTAASITAAVTTVVAGANAGKKLEEANKKKKEVLTEAEFKALIEADGSVQGGKKAVAKKKAGGGGNKAPVVDWAKGGDPPLPAPTDKMIADVEKKFKNLNLPASYVALMRQRNGGDLGARNYCNGEHSATSIYGIGVDPGIVSEQENWTGEWEYPVEKNGKYYVYFAETESGGHDMVAFEYDLKNKDREPKVVNIDQEGDFRVLVLADTFEEWCASLCKSKYDDDDDDEDDE